MRLSFDGFDDAYFGASGDDFGKIEAGLLEERAVLVFGAFFAAGNHEHYEVEELAAERFVPGRNDAFYQKKPTVRGHGAVAVAEDGE